MNNLCTKCSHKQLCKFKEDFEKIDAKIDFYLKELEEANKQMFFNIKIDCQFFREAIPLVRSTKVPEDDLISDRTYDPCKNCLNKPDLSKGPIIGDTPCDWCDKNPYKITCLKTNL